MNAVRLPALVVIIALIVGAFVFQVQTEEEVSQSKEPLAYSELSFGLPLEETSGDVWFCLGPTNKLDGVDDQIISITNLSSTGTEGLKWTISDSEGSVAERAIQVEGKSQLEILTSQEKDTAKYVGVTLEAPTGDILVEQYLEATDYSGLDQGFCGTTTSSSWVVPWGTTERPGAKQTLLLYNPFQATAVADLLFVGDQGLRETLDSQGIVIPGRSVVAYELTERIPDAPLLSSYVEVRTGQLVVSGLSIADGTAPSGIKGLSIVSGSPEIGGDLFLPGSDGEQTPGAVVIVNPSQLVVEGELVVRPGDSDLFVEPFGFVLRSGQRQVIELSDHSRLEGIGPYSLYIRSLDNPNLSASYIERSLSNAVSENSEEATTAGLDVLPAVGYGATNWLTKVLGSPGSPAKLTIFNPSLKSIAAINLWTEDEVALPDSFELDPGDRATLDLEVSVRIGVESSSPVIVVTEWLGPEGRTSDYGISLEDTVSSIQR